MEINNTYSAFHHAFAFNSVASNPSQNDSNGKLQPEQDIASKETTSTETTAISATQQNPEVLRQISELRIRDLEVRAHELAHLAAAGGIAKGGPTFDYQRGPDGKLYAVGGEVQIDTSGVPGDPEATLQKAEQIQRAALAPAQPSAQDRSVAMAAAAMAAEARAEITSHNSERNSHENASNDHSPDNQRLISQVNEAYTNNFEQDQSRKLLDLVA
ncbi:MAG: hypothetical protein IT525_08430 [Nitrosomonas sp.]|jgi:hypothetical protein|nr:hypothetical protein [Nitrosomonas sp.]